MERSNTSSNMEVAKLPGFDREAERMREFIMTCRLYLRMRIRGTILEDLEMGEAEFGLAEEFLLELKRSLEEKMKK